MNLIIKLTSSKCVDVILNWLRKRRTSSLKLVFPILIVEDIITGKKPHELNPFEEPSEMAVIAVILIFGRILIRFWARGHFVKVQGRLATTGPYALTRHPLYLGSILIIIGVLCQLNDWLNWAVIVPLLVIFYGGAIIHEEKSLQKRFAEKWQSYKSEVPAFIPSVRNFHHKGYVQHWSGQTYLVTGEITTTLLALSIPLVIELLEEVVFEGILKI